MIVAMQISGPGLCRKGTPRWILRATVGDLRSGLLREFGKPLLDALLAGGEISAHDNVQAARSLIQDLKRLGAQGESTLSSLRSGDLTVLDANRRLRERLRAETIGPPWE